MNVALTRARSSIWILGDSNKLRANQYWGQLVADAEARSLFRKVRSLASFSHGVSSLTVRFVQADVQLFRSSYSAPPVVRTALPSVPVSRSRAKAIEMSPAYLSSSSPAAKPNASGLVAPTPPHLVNGSALKKRLTDAMDVDSPASAKRPKLEEGEVDERKPRVQVPRPPVQRPQAPPQPVKRRPEPSLFVPKKVSTSRSACPVPAADEASWMS